jgi:hypothetical protein
MLLPTLALIKNPSPKQSYNSSEDIISHTVSTEKNGSLFFQKNIENIKNKPPVDGMQTGGLY